MSLYSANVSFFKDHPDAVIPSRMSEEAAGFDVTAITYEEIGDGLYMLDTHLIAKPPMDVWMMLVARSSLFKHNLMPVNGIGILDQDYRGHIKFILKAMSADHPVKMKMPMRFGQLVFMSQQNIGRIEIKEKPICTIGRGTGGFGSTN